MSSDEFLAEIQEALELDDLEMAITDNFREYEEWDSLTFLSLMTLMRSQYGVNVDIDTFNAVTTWQDLYNLVQK
ncbi:MAG: acyl carrier protein [Akkermansia sp.]|nr:acyl carrier protein [Akkermansia sp.]